MEVGTRARYPLPSLPRLGEGARGGWDQVLSCDKCDSAAARVQADPLAEPGARVMRRLKATAAKPATASAQLVGSGTTRFDSIHSTPSS